MSEKDYRKESDSMGELKVPSQAQWGAQTQRAIENFQISDIRAPRKFISALGLVKWSAASTNEELGLLEKEKSIAQEQAEGKPPQAVENIVNGKINKFYATNCLVEQGFVKNPDVSIKDYISTVSQSLGDVITIDKFLRFQVGESF